MKLIVNADDFGLCSSVNMAISDLFKRKIINSATIMANMDGFEEAIELAHINKFTKRLGVHLNITDGSPLTTDVRKTHFFHESSMGHQEKIRKAMFLSRDHQNLIYNEFSAQIERVQKSGISISHLDTHHHAHEAWPILNILMNLSEKYEISSIRILNNLNSEVQFHKKIYRKFANYIISRNDMNFSDYFGNQEEIQKIWTTNPLLFKNKIVEMMVHPDTNLNNEIIDKVKGNEIGFKYPDHIKEHIQLTW